MRKRYRLPASLNNGQSVVGTAESGLEGDVSWRFEGVLLRFISYFNEN